MSAKDYLQCCNVSGARIYCIRINKSTLFTIKETICLFGTYSIGERHAILCHSVFRYYYYIIFFVLKRRLILSYLLLLVVIIDFSNGLNTHKHIQKMSRSFDFSLTYTFRRTNKHTIGHKLSAPNYINK